MMDLILFGGFSFEAPFVDRWKRRNPEWTGLRGGGSSGLELVDAVAAFRLSPELALLRRRALADPLGGPAVRRQLWFEVTGDDGL